MKEAYCSYKISKLLREKGFDERIFEFYEGDKIKYARNGEGFRLSELPGIYYPHITHQMAMAWLREKKDVYIEIRRSLNTYLYGAIIAEGIVEKYRIKNTYNFYEDAVEAALEYVLENLI